MARTGRPRPKGRRTEAAPVDPPAAPAAPPAVAAPVGPAAGADAGASAERAWRRGVRLGVDVGSVRVGLAACDPDGLVATAVATLPRERPAAPAGRGPGRDGGRSAARGAPPVDPGALPADVARLAAEVVQRGAVEVVVGLPRSLSGDEGRAASTARQYAGRLADVVAPVPVRLVDERLSTAGAHRALHEGGTSGRRHRSVVDQVAAAWILQTALDLERSSGRPPGSLARPLGPDGRRRDRAQHQDEHHPHEQEEDGPPRGGPDRHEHQDDDEVGRRTGALRTGPDAQGRARSPHPEEDATVSTTPHPVPRPPRRPAPPADGAGSAQHVGGAR